MLQIKALQKQEELREFIEMPWKIYQQDHNWVPPLKKKLLEELNGKNNILLMNGPYQFLIAYRNNKPVARILVGINEKLNREKNKSEGYISLFESINDQEVCFPLLEQALEWLSEKGIRKVVGPISPTNGDENRGLLIKGYTGPPVLMNAYNPDYYPELLEQFGFKKYLDFFAYYLDEDLIKDERLKKIVAYAMKRYHFHIDSFDLHCLDREVADLKAIFEQSMPDTWEHLVPPSVEEIKAEINRMKKLIEPEFICIARSKENEPIGCVWAFPDYNQVLIKLNGQLDMIGLLKFWWYRRKIKGMRLFSQFVVPKYRDKAVNGAIFYHLLLQAKKKKYSYGEASTIGEMNKKSIMTVEKSGGLLYRIYRIYQKDL